MPEYIWTFPTANKRHLCGFSYCGRIIFPGEQYGRMAGFDRGTAYTYKLCLHCYRVCQRMTGRYDEYWDDDCIVEHLEETDPAVYSQMQVGWRTPEGELLPLPLQARCFTCHKLLSEDVLWCNECDKERIEKINQQFAKIRQQLAA